MDQQKADQTISNNKSVSFLHPTTLQWINKRRPHNEESSVKVMTASRAVQLRNVFRSLDFDNSGAISLNELKEAIDFVAADRKTGPPLIENPEMIKVFFESMDEDQNGVVDFNEFLTGMTAQAQDDKNAKQNARMQQAFYDFANLHKRQKIIEYLENKEVKSDADKFRELKKLFSIQFIREEEEVQSVEEQIKKAQTSAKEEMREMNSEHRKIRHTELCRSRSAMIYFDAEKHNKVDPHNVRDALSKLKIQNSAVGLKVEKKLRTRLSKFSLPSTPSHVPSLSQSKSASSFAYSALLESQRIKSGPQSTALLLPAIRMKDQIQNRAKAAK